MNYPLMTYKAKKVSLFVLGYVVFLIFLRCVIVFVYDSTPPVFLNYTYDLLAYVTIASLIWINRKQLDKNNIDKFSLIVILVFGSILRPTYGGISIFLAAGYYLILSAISLFLFIKLKQRNDQVNLSRPHNMSLWLGIALLSNIILLVFLLSVKESSSIALSRYSFFISAVSYFLYSLGNTSISEEPIFRGFLLNALQEFGFSIKTAIFLQSLLFALVHIQPFQQHSIGKLLFYFVDGAFMGLMAWKSRSIFPSMIQHALWNTIIYLFLFQ